jgi:hypothetical protein
MGNHHKLADINLRLLAQGSPEIVGSGVSVGVLLEVVGNSVEEGLNTKVVTEHADGSGSLQVTDVVEDLVNLQGV